MQKPEPWLRGPIPGVNPLVANLFYSFAQAREELAGVLAGLGEDEIWLRPHGLAPVGFHIRHMGGAAERLGCYLAGRALSEEQLTGLQREDDPRVSGEELMAQLARRTAALERQVMAMDVARLSEHRQVGRARLPTTAIGLIVHIAEHTQRHLGQAITTAKLIKNLRGGESGEQASAVV